MFQTNVRLIRSIIDQPGDGERITLCETCMMHTKIEFVEPGDDVTNDVDESCADCEYSPANEEEEDEDEDE